MSNRRVRNAWRNPEPYVGSSPSGPVGSDAGASPHPARQTPDPAPNRPGLRQRSHPALDRSSLRRSPPALGYPSPALDRFSLRRSDPAPRLEGGLSVNRALSVSPRSQIGTINRVRPRMVGGQTAYRAAANVSTTSESRRQQVSATRPPVRPGRNGAEGGRGAGSHDSQGLAEHKVRTTEPRFEGTQISLTRKARPAAPPGDRGSRLPGRPASQPPSQRLAATPGDSRSTRSRNNPSRPLVTTTTPLSKNG